MLKTGIIWSTPKPSSTAEYYTSSICSPHSQSSSDPTTPASG
jgi:hypothetical protein